MKYCLGLVCRSTFIVMINYARRYSCCEDNFSFPSVLALATHCQKRLTNLLRKFVSLQTFFRSFVNSYLVFLLQIEIKRIIESLFESKVLVKFEKYEDERKTIKHNWLRCQFPCASLSACKVFFRFKWKKEKVFF